MTAAAIIAAIVEGGPLVLNFWLKIRNITNLTPDEHANILREVALSDAADEETKARAAHWLNAHPVLGLAGRFTTRVK